MKSLLAVIALTFLSLSAVNAQQTSVLFLGNSYTYTADLPGTLYNLALEGGDTIYHESNTPGGYTFQNHSTNATSLNKIAGRNWDFVVLQEQSQLPSFPNAQVESDVYPYAEILVDSIRSNYECSEPVFFMTWGRQAGDQQNCAGFPPLCTFEGMQQRLRNAYLQMGMDNDATVAPCGAAWQQMALSNSTFWNGLYSGDGSHPSAWGTYLNACVFYATIFRRSPVGIEYYSSIGQADAEVLQQLAEEMVLDSLSTWNIGHADVLANATGSATGLSVSFQNTSENATDHSWDFGDGNISTDPNPQHVFANSGDFTVTHIASSNCDSDTAYYELSLSPNGIANADQLTNVELNQIGNHFVVKNGSDHSLQFQVVDLSGRVVMNEEIIPSHDRTIEFSGMLGAYLIRLSNGAEWITRKVMIN